MSYFPQFTTQDHIAWQAEEQKLALSSMKIGQWVAIVTYCLFIYIFTVVTYPFSWYTTFILWFPAPITLFANWLAHRKPEYFTVCFHLIPLAIYVSNSWAMIVNDYMFVERPSLLFMYILASIPIFIAPTLVAFWKYQQEVIMLVYGFIISVIPCFILEKPYAGDVIQLWLLVIPICCAGIAFTQFRYSNTKKTFLFNQVLKRNQEELALKNAELAEKNENILDSIRYANRIQTSILPEVSEIENYLYKSFVFYIPKDIVSGDLYCFARVDDVSIIAVIDCTGHGVPGAFMSVIANNLFSQITLERRITQPSEILYRMDQGVQAILKQDPNQRQQDGMDICLCCFDFNQQKLQYAGANRKLYQLREGIIHEFPGSKFPIGDARLTDKQFDTHTIDLIPKDRYYLFSDGITDQFGGEGDKIRKFSPKRLQEFILQYQEFPIKDQGIKLQQIFNDWKGNYAQTDDVCVIGVEV